MPPLLNKKPFVRNKVNLDRLKDSDELFYCTQTGEAFEDYEYEQRGGYRVFDDPGVLFRQKRPDIMEQLSVKSVYELNLENLYKYEVEVLTNSMIFVPHSEKTKNPRKFFPPENLYKYEVEVLTDGTTAVMNKDALVTVPADKIRRKKFVYTQEKNRLFIRQFVENDCPNGKGVFKVKDSVYKKYNLGQTQWSKIFVGSEPKFYRQPTKSPPVSNQKPSTSNTSNSAKKKSQQPTLDHFVTKKSSPTKMNAAAAKDAANAKAAKEAKEKEVAEKLEKKRITLEEIQRKQKEEKLQLQEKKKQEKLKLAEFMKEYQKKKEDLELEDLKELPEPSPIHMKLPNKYFGHLVQILEFANIFDKFVGQKRFFPKGNQSGLTFEVLEKALLDSEVEGPLNDLLQMLLSAVYHVLELEEDEMNDSSKSRFVLQGSIDKTITESSDPVLNKLTELASKAKDWAMHTQGCSFPQIPVDYYTITEVLRLHLLCSGSRMDDFVLRWRIAGSIDKTITESSDPVLNKLTELASKAKDWAMHTQGCSFPQIPVDYYTITEVLRLHLLCSGSRMDDFVLRWRYEQRGGYRVFDDPGVLFRQKRPDIMEQLSVKSVYEMYDKLEILQVLIDQILTYADVRDLIDEKMEKARRNRADFRLHYSAQMKKEREEVFKLKEQKKENKEKEKLEDIDKEIAELVERNKEKLQSESIRIAVAIREPQLLALGYDRAFRRYWVFKSVSGLYVEHNPQHVGDCIPGGTPCIDKMNMPDPDTLEYMKRLFEESNNKENLGNRALVKDILSTPVKNFVREGVNTEDKVKPRVAWVCSGHKSTCQVHNVKPGHPVWYYYKTEDDINKLISTLSDRGFREHELKEALTQERDRILKGLPNVPFFISNAIESMEVDRPAESDKNHSFVLDLALRDQLLDLEYKITAGGLGSLKVSDVGEWRKKLEDGSYDESVPAQWPKEVPDYHRIIGKPMDFGTIKHKLNMFQYRNNSEVLFDCNLVFDNCFAYNKEDSEIYESGEQLKTLFDKICKERHLFYIEEDMSPDSRQSKRRKNKMGFVLVIICSLSITNITIPFLHCFLNNESCEERNNANSLPERKRKARHSVEPVASDLPLDNAVLQEILDELMHDPNAWPFLRPVSPRLSPHHRKTVTVPANLQGLKVALLQLEQSVTAKFFSRPLGAGKPTRKVSNKVSNLTQHWEASLKRCTSLSQVFIHLGALEKSILWSKSLLKTNCKVCKTRADPEQMLLCDSCDKGFHTYCLTPKLKKIPEGDWHCPTCKPIEKPAKVKKPTRTSEPFEEEKKTVFGKCKVCLDKVPLISCDSCSNGYHMACLEPPLRKIPRGKWTCQACRRLSAVMRRDGEEEEVEVLRASHRRCAKAASSKISHIAQQILSNHSDDGRQSKYCSFHKFTCLFSVPDYHRIIGKPMDFGTIKHKLNMFQYRNNSEVLFDCNLVFDNCFAYNKEDSEIYESGEQLKTLFDKICKERHLFYIEEDMSPDSRQSKRRKK
ncbi:bromodomain adjacent to zinc finger domain protein 1A [Diaphorina citri]|uniref:Bromodomain adjacent to zinc finger domain protein 1A n=1 Tax=Diaphorina citri TaxID=121845 RepID=A0A3Q0IQ45_DIACI|nr:bromodomain adjacent to zinc finger domain protein 1A [Diaphorina citri]